MKYAITLLKAIQIPVDAPDDGQLLRHDGPYVTLRSKDGDLFTIPAAHLIEVAALGDEPRIVAPRPQ